MMIVTAKIRWKRCILALVGAVLAILALVLAVCRWGSGAASPAFGVRSGTDDASRVAYLTQLGWQVEETPLSQEEILIPTTLDQATYGPYLAILEEAGFDLTDYAGKTVTRYTYSVTNYPTGEEDVIAGLLVYQGKIVGGEIMSAALDGFIHSLNYPS